MDERYLSEETAREYRLNDVPRLIKLAWDIALIFPEFGDEIIEDLIADVRFIIDRERLLLADEAKTTAQQFWGERISRAYRHGHELVVSQTAALSADGIDPHGWRVYMLWAKKGDEKPIYVGRSFNVLSRLGSHMNDREKRYATGWVSIIDCPTELDMERTEQSLIARHQPVLNSDGCRNG